MKSLYIARYTKNNEEVSIKNLEIFGLNIFARDQTFELQIPDESFALYHELFMNSIYRVIQNPQDFSQLSIKNFVSPLTEKEIFNKFISAFPFIIFNSITYISAKKELLLGVVLEDQKSKEQIKKQISLDFMREAFGVGKYEVDFVSGKAEEDSCVSAASSLKSPKFKVILSGLDFEGGEWDVFINNFFENIMENVNIHESQINKEKGEFVVYMDLHGVSSEVFWDEQFAGTLEGLLDDCEDVKFIVWDLSNNSYVYSYPSSENLEQGKMVSPALPEKKDNHPKNSEKAQASMESMKNVNLWHENSKSNFSLLIKLSLVASLKASNPLDFLKKKLQDKRNFLFFNNICMFDIENIKQNGNEFLIPAFSKFNEKFMNRMLLSIVRPEFLLVKNSVNSDKNNVSGFSM